MGLPLADPADAAGIAEAPEVDGDRADLDRLAHPVPIAPVDLGGHPGGAEILPSGRRSTTRPISLLAVGRGPSPFSSSISAWGVAGSWARPAAVAAVALNAS